MKASFVKRAIAVVLLAGAFSLSTPVFGDATRDALNKAFDLVHQAWNPGGDPPSDAERTKLLTQALAVTKNVPDHHLKGHRVQAMIDIKSALEALKSGDPDHQAGELIHNAADELRDALSIAE